MVNKLVYFEPGSMCDLPPEFTVAPLPATKRLWEAGNEAEWRIESQKGSNKIAYELAADGEIVRLNQDWLSCSDAWLPYSPPSDDDIGTRIMSKDSAECWREWSSGIDNFGGLVMLAALPTA